MDKELEERKLNRVMYASKPDHKSLQLAYTLGNGQTVLGSICTLIMLVLFYHSKWLDVKMVNLATSNSTIEHLRSVFSVHAPVTDNGTVFTSSEFQDFNVICHIRTAPYHPAPNGQEKC